MNRKKLLNRYLKKNPNKIKRQDKVESFKKNMKMNIKSEEKARTLKKLSETKQQPKEYAKPLPTTQPPLYNKHSYSF